MVKLGMTQLENFEKFQLPLKKTDDLNIKATLNVLTTKNFDEKTFLFLIRCQCLQLTKNVNNNFVIYADTGKYITK